MAKKIKPKKAAVKKKNEKTKPKPRAKSSNKKSKSKGKSSGQFKNARRPGKSRKKLQKTRTKRKPLKKKKALKKKKIKITALQVTRRLNKFIRENVNSRGQFRGLTKQFTPEVIEMAEYDIKSGIKPDLIKYIQIIKNKYLEFSETIYNTDIYSVKNIIAIPNYFNKKIKIISLFGNVFETKYNIVAEQIVEDNISFYWAIIDKARELGYKISPFFKVEITERRQLKNRLKNKIPRVLKIDFSKDNESGVELSVWQKAKAIIKKELGM